VLHYQVMHKQSNLNIWKFKEWKNKSKKEINKLTSYKRKTPNSKVNATKDYNKSANKLDKIILQSYNSMKMVKPKPVTNKK
jgi:hypothetical protein